MRETFLPFAEPSIGEEEIAAVVDTLRGGWLTSGPKVQQFEEEFAVRVGSAYAVAVNSCTAALHCALEAVGVGHGDEVLTTPMTFASSAAVIIHLGARPVFVDIDPLTMNIDPALLENAVAKCRNAKAIIPVHIAGLACDMDPILATAKKHGLRVIEDAAHCLPTSYKGRTIGTIGDATCFSFYPTKTIITGEGGMATTNDEAIADRMRLMSLHGMTKNAWKRYEAQGNWRYEITAPGYKYNMPEMAAALGLVQLEKADRHAEQRRSIAERYTEAFSECADWLETPPDAPPDGEHSWHLYIIKLQTDRLSIDRDQFIEQLGQAKIGVSVHFIPLHMQPYYKDTYGYSPEDFPVSNSVSQRIISLPIYPKMTDADVQSVVDAMMDIGLRHIR